MNIIQLAQEASLLFQQVEPGLTAAVKVGGALGTMGSTGIKVLQKGKQLITYWIGTIKKDSKTKKGETPSTSVIAPVLDTLLLASKDDVAILVDINRRMLIDVARYLEKQNIDSDLIIVTNDAAYSDQIEFLGIDDPAEWSTLVREFTTAMNAIKRIVGGARLHILLSAPLPIAFGMGAVWGTVDQAVIYHWQAGTYHPVMNISRELRQSI